METLSVPPWRYYPGSRRKKNSVQAKYDMDCFLGVPIFAITQKQWRMVIGMGLTLGGKVYCLA